jgi:hypothetical protein
MSKADRWSRILVIAGLVAMVAGLLDPMEGSLVILAGSLLVALGARLGKSRHMKLIRWSYALVVIGVGALWVSSARGGFGGDTGRSNWWALVCVPYPIGWVLGILGAVRVLREFSKPAVASGTE